uniref:DUF4376 domain-containing protein n=1 Tax=Candidatus Kentrum sp. LFY TaxID=2126342 RepID=A0A450UE28_9GAMM|nr:MAG: hypothetical protein BECKLFY1418A_GA0070994_101318 [Candidatus Kentron sp. LFY]
MNTKETRPRLYYFDGVTKVELPPDPRIGPILAQPNPMEKGKWLVPMYATLDVPDKAPAGYVSVRKSGKWVIEEDHRGKTVYRKGDGSKYVITEVGPLPDDVTEKEKPSGFHYWSVNDWVFDRDEAIDHMNGKINEYRDSRLNHGGVQVNGVWFRSDLVSSTEALGFSVKILQAKLSRMTSSPSGGNEEEDSIEDILPWEDMDGNVIAMTNDFIARVLDIAEVVKLTTYSVSREHKNKMRKSDNPLEYDFKKGWPKIFQEHKENKREENQ